MAKADGAHLKELTRIEKQDVLILDDFGVQPLDNQSRSLLLDIIEDRHGMIISHELTHHFTAN
jgi:DNA replication protein DnaC